MNTRLAEILDQSTNVAIIMAAAALVIFVARSILQPAKNVSLSSWNVTYAAGQTLPSVAGVHYDKSRANVLIVLNSHCKYCNASMPFYRTLLAAPAVTEGRIQLIAVSREDLKSLRAFLDSHGLARLTAAHTDASFRAPATPTVLLCDGQGRVLNVWVGRVGPSVEQEIRSEVARIAGL